MPLSNALQVRRARVPKTLRGRVWLRRRHLDDLLASGASPHETAELGRRAAQLTTPRCRHAVAAGLERVLGAAQDPPRGYSARVPVARREILAAAGLIRELAAELRYGDRVNPRAVAMAQRLLTHGDSPLYAAVGGEGLDPALRHIRSALLLG